MINLDEIIDAINAMALDEDAKMAIEFAEMFPAIASAKARGIPDKQIIEGLKSKWRVTLHHATFRKLWDVELKVRNERAECVICMTCNQPLRSKNDSDASEDVALSEVNDQTAGGAS
jgi:hypothetical protein